MSEKLIARKGDKHDCPLHGEGEIIDGFDAHLVEGLPVARVGDRIKCPDGSIAVIEDNNCCMEIAGKKVARIGDKTSHGGTITTGASSVTAKDGKVSISFGGTGKVSFGKNVHFGSYVPPNAPEPSVAAAIALEVLKEAAIGALLAAAGMGLTALGVTAPAGVVTAAVGVTRLGKAGQKLYKAAKAGKAVDITKKGSKLNLEAKITRAQLEKNLKKSGFTEKTTKTEGVSVFHKTDKKYGKFEYSVRDHSNAGLPTAEGRINNEFQFKLRLKK
jgi:uncharacterized Zn-binding protein involved in type VI secretion